MIGYRRLSVCLSVTLCFLALRVVVHGLKLYQRVPSRQVPICSFGHFCCRMYRLATKRAKSKKTRTSIFWDRPSGMNWSHYTFCYSLTSWTLVSHAWVDWVWVRSQTLPVRPVKSDRAQQAFANFYDFSLPVYHTSQQPTAELLVFFSWTF